MGKVPDRGPSPKAPPHFFYTPKPSGSGGGPHTVLTHNPGYGPRPTPRFVPPGKPSGQGGAPHQAAHSRAYGPRGSGVHAAVQAQPVRSSGHSAAVARLASKLAQQSSAGAGAGAKREALLQGLLRLPNAWTPARLGVSSGVYGTADAMSVLTHALGLKTIYGQLEKAVGDAPLPLGPQGGFLKDGFPGYDRLPQTPGMGHRGAITSQQPIPTFPVPRTPQARVQQQRALGFRTPNSPVPQGPRPSGMRGSGRGPNFA